MPIIENHEQYVYVLSNPSYPNDYLKIGWTRYNPRIRAKSLQTSGIPTPFVIEYVIITSDGSKLEHQIHEYINEYRVNDKREFFKISKDMLTKILTEELVLELTPVDEIVEIKETNVVIKKTKTKQVIELEELYKTLEKSAHVFFGKINKINGDIVVTHNEKYDKKCVYIQEVVYNIFSLDMHGLEDDAERLIKQEYRVINQDIALYKKLLNDIVNNYKEIKNSIGVELIRKDNSLLKKMILDTHKQLNSLKNDYIWETAIKQE